MSKANFSYDDAIEYLYGLQKYGIKFGLHKTSNLLKAFGDPHRARRYVHIAGSNGKGSVGAMLESILIRSGLKVGFYSSPHLTRFTERFRVNGREICTDRAAGIACELIKLIDPVEPPTFFEVTTAMALIFFAREETDISIMEVGMGGRLDATNVIDPMVSVITNISLDHQGFLGSRILDIAAEKAGVIKDGVDLITAETRPTVIRFFREVCVEKKAPFWRVGKDVRYRSNGSRLDYHGLERHLKGLVLSLKGRFQNRNAAVALTVIELLERKGFEISPDHIRQGLENTSWPGRMQVVSREPLIILDGGHNPGAIKELAGSIRRDFRYRRLILVLGVMADKDIKTMIRGIVPLAEHVIYTKPDYARSASPESLQKSAAPWGVPGEILQSIPQAIDRAKELAADGDMILICGSLFTVGEAVTYFENLSQAKA